METRRLFICGEIGYDWADYEKQKLFYSDVTNLEVFIDSVGGSVSDGHSFAALLKLRAAQGATVLTVGIGQVASIATSLLFSGTTVQLDPQCTVLIHTVTIDWFSGNSTEMRQTADTMDMMTQNLTDLYIKRIEKSGKATDKTRKQVEQMMTKQTWLSAQQCLDLGLIDAIYAYPAESAEAQARIDAMPTAQLNQYQTIVNKFKNQIKTTMPENKEEKTEKGFFAMLKSWFANEVETTPLVVVEPITVAEVAAPKTIAEMTDEEIKAELLKRNPTAVAAPAVVDAKTTELTNKIAAMEKELAMQKTKTIVNHTPATTPVVLSKKEQELKDFNNRLMSIPSVKTAFENHK